MIHIKVLCFKLFNLRLLKTSTLNILVIYLKYNNNRFFIILFIILKKYYFNFDSPNNNHKNISYYFTMYISFPNNPSIKYQKRIIKDYINY